MCIGLREGRAYSEIMNSLDILLPPRSLLEDYGQKSATTLYIEDLTASVPKCISERNWTHPVWKHFAPGFQSFIEFAEHPNIKSGKDWLELHKKISSSHPKYRLEVFSVSGHVDEEAGTATVWMVMRVFGHPDEKTVKENVTTAHVHRKDGDWYFTRHRSMRGIQIDP